MLQVTETARRLSAFRGGSNLSCCPAGMILLLPGFLAGLPAQLMLWATGALFLAITVCPSRTARACGVNAHVGWSSSTVFSLRVFRLSWIGGFLPPSAVIQTKTFFMP